MHLPKRTERKCSFLWQYHVSLWGGLRRGGVVVFLKGRGGVGWVGVGIDGGVGDGSREGKRNE